MKKHCLVHLIWKTCAESLRGQQGIVFVKTRQNWELSCCLFFLLFNLISQTYNLLICFLTVSEMGRSKKKLPSTSKSNFWSVQTRDIKISVTYKTLMMFHDEQRLIQPSKTSLLLTWHHHNEDKTQKITETRRTY